MIDTGPLKGLFWASQLVLLILCPWYTLPLLFIFYLLVWVTFDVSRSLLKHLIVVAKRFINQTHT